jgi:hypothetical protein
MYRFKIVVGVMSEAVQRGIQAICGFDTDDGIAGLKHFGFDKRPI